ncbi:MAG: hypothetical protein WC421_10290 [Elusimicrobiales bacterium]
MKIILACAALLCCCGAAMPQDIDAAAAGAQSAVETAQAVPAAKKENAALRQGSSGGQRYGGAPKPVRRGVKRHKSGQRLLVPVRTAVAQSSSAVQAAPAAGTAPGQRGVSYISGAQNDDADAAGDADDSADDAPQPAAGGSSVPASYGPLKGVASAEGGALMFFEDEEGVIRAVKFKSYGGKTVLEPAASIGRR